jgi:hypothetical protein
VSKNKNLRIMAGSPKGGWREMAEQKPRFTMHHVAWRDLLLLSPIAFGEINYLF